MELIVTVEHRFRITPDGKVWTQAQFGNSFWKRYLDVFDHIHVVARARHVAKHEPDLHRVDGPQVSFHPLPHYVGPFQYLWKALELRREIRRVFDPRHAVIFRIGSQIANCMEPHLRRLQKPFAIEAVADPWMIFAPGANRHPLRAIFRRKFSSSMRRQCRSACAAAYVTKSSLQERYPPADGAYSTYCSDVELPDPAFSPRPRARFDDDPLRLVTVGSMAQPYKAYDVLIAAVSRCLREGTKLHLTIIGDGKHRAELEAQAEAAGCRDQVRFAGQLPAGNAIRDQLDQADLFVLPSRVEGLPRAMIEAMAKALPCIGTTVGGIPELLPPKDRVPANDIDALAEKIREVVSNPDRLKQMSERNLSKAADYHENILQQRRIAFYQAVRDANARWLASANGTTSASSGG